MSRVIVVGNAQNPYSLERYFLEGAEELGLLSAAVPYRGSRVANSSKSPEAWRRRYWTRRTKALVEQLGALQLTADDVVLFVKCRQMFHAPSLLARVLATLRDSKHALVAPDALSSFVAEEQLRTYCGAGGLVATYDSPAEKAHYGEWLSPALRTYEFGYSKKTHWTPIDSSVAQSSGHCVFVGTWDPARERVLSELSDDLPIAVYGPYWSRGRRRSRLSIESTRVVHGEEHARIVQRHALVLNVPREQNLRKGNMRTYETPAQGGVAGYLLGERRLTEEVWGATTSDFVEQADAWLSKPRMDRLARATQAHEEVEFFSYGRRLKELLQSIEG